jgi:hypothetical protein
VPAGVVTSIGPVTAPAGTVAVICVSESTTNVVAATPPNRTAVAPVKQAPVIVTTVPAEPLVGAKLAIVGSSEAVTEKLVVVLTVPSVSVTSIGPVVAVAGTVAVICVFESTVNVAATLLNVTLDTGLGASSNPLPVIVTAVPAGPQAGLNDVIVGGAANAGWIPRTDRPSTTSPASAARDVARRVFCFMGTTS